MLIGAGLLAVVLVAASARAAYMRVHPPEYHSEVTQADCLLCGEPNDFRGADALLFVVVRKEHWDADNVGMIQYCREDRWAWDGCWYENYKDESLTTEELAHKNLPFDINGVLKQHNEEFTSTRSFPMFDDKTGVSGTMYTNSKNGLLAGALNIARCAGADPDYLSTVLCQDCFDKVYPITRHANFFFVDSLTGEVYPICDSEYRSFDIRNYHFFIQSQTLWTLDFYATYSEELPEA